MVTASTFTKINIIEAQKRLNFAIEFYSYGFRQIIGTLKEQSQDPNLQNVAPVNWRNLINKMIIDIVWAIIFWGSILISIFA